jgi:hypothetical protein
MNCTEFEDRIQELLDRGTFTESPGLVSPALAQHLSECASCRTWGNAARTLCDAITAWRDETFEVDLRAGVVAQHLREAPGVPSNAVLTGRSGEPSVQPARPSWPVAAVVPFHSPSASPAGRGDAAARTRWTLLASLAALALLVSLSAVPSFERHEQIAARRSAASLSVAKSSSSLPQNMSDRPADDSPYVALSRQAGGVLAQLFVAGDNAAQPMPTAPAGKAAAGSWFDGLQSQWQPVEESLGNAFDFLWQAGDAHDSART